MYLDTFKYKIEFYILITINNNNINKIINNKYKND